METARLFRRDLEQDTKVSPAATGLPSVLGDEKAVPTLGLVSVQHAARVGCLSYTTPSPPPKSFVDLSSC